MAWRAHRRDGHLHYIKAPAKAEQAAVLLPHGGQKICCFLSQLLSELLFGFCLKIQRGENENSQSDTQSVHFILKQ